ncbi:MAG: RDD family protein [Acidimicrobiales bacterium]|nr:RDD family protein [Acidimicrobiales bacterium]
MQPQIPPFADDPTAVMGRRTLAFVIDALIGTALIFVTVLATFTTTEFASTLAAEDICTQMDFFTDNVCINSGSTVWVGESDDVGMLMLVWGVYVLVNTLLLPGFTGWSLGKLVMGLRVVKQDTFERAGMGANMGRGVSWVLDAFPWFLPLAGLILGLATPGHRRIGDLVAKTFVVDKSLVGHPTPVRGVGSVPASAPAAFGDASPVGMPPAPPSTSIAPPPPTSITPPPPTSITPPPPTGIAQAPLTTPLPPFAAPTGPPVVASPTPTPPMPASAPPPAFPPTPSEPESIDQPLPDEMESALPEADQIESVDSEPVDSEPQQLGTDGPQWDQARDTYIQWDPELSEWMEWSESGGRWIPISR